MTEQEMVGELVAAWFNTDACPDCRADVRLFDLGGGVSALRVEHDGSCAWLRSHERKVER